MSQKVFAYGSNMCSGRFRDYGVAPEGDGSAAVLIDYRLVFNKKSRDGSGKANIEPHRDSEVWGVLYTVPDADLATLDYGEGLGYHRKRLEVHPNDNRCLGVWAYVASRPSDDPLLRPYTWYKRFLVEGAKEHALPHEYISALERLAGC
ncbi:MAG: gamma-glutamylcyclotransferase [Bryobacteraceae bacterium]|nr:gamma-glutamylcyclotransferase [Bryobacterales bacterium]MEB2363897.1 gamma-glutamylcyclotransferase [Bryobacterales bacterium]NUN03612.1 gamma-glutamylcyclotransferase [Bryobacteraceae bacterium]